jgi:SAM-dependent methyltransferase
VSLTPGQEPLADAGYRAVPDEAGGAAARAWWDAHADEYLAEHGAALGAADFAWGPEGLREDDARLLGDPADLAGAGARVLEVGAGAAQCSRWLAARGVAVVATDVSGGMLRAAARLDAATGIRTRRVQADARALPFADSSFDVAFTAFGALPFVPDAGRVHVEVARVLRPGGRWVFATTHPLRWPFPDDPTAAGLTAQRSYFDRTPYVETAADGSVLYVEYHRTLGDLVAEVTSAGLVIDRLMEPEWPERRTQVWGGWGPVRGRMLPGTLVVATHRPA